MRQWNEVEAEFARTYHLSLDDIFNMSWRRFRVLFGGVFSWKDDEKEEEKPGTGRIASHVDWNRAEHVPVQELGTGISIHRTPVGKTTDG